MFQLAKLIHRFRHCWKIVRDNGKTVYEKCSVCEKRRIRQRQGGYQPVDYQWIKTGKWSYGEKRLVPPHGGSAINHKGHIHD